MLIHLSVLQTLLDAGVIPGSDTTPEAALTKLCYVLGKEGLTHGDRRYLMKSNLRGEIKVSDKDEKSLTLLDNTFICAVADTLRITSHQVWLTHQNCISLCNVLRFVHQCIGQVANITHSPKISKMFLT